MKNPSWKPTTGSDGDAGADAAGACGALVPAAGADAEGAEAGVDAEGACADAATGVGTEAGVCAGTGAEACAAAGGGAAITAAAPIAVATNTRANEKDIQISRKARGLAGARTTASKSG